MACQQSCKRPRGKGPLGTVAQLLFMELIIQQTQETNNIIKSTNQDTLTMIVVSVSADLTI